MTSAAVAVTLSAWRRGARGAAAGFAAIALVFAYTTVVNVVERPDGVKIAGFFIAAIVAVSLVSRLWRTLELRVERIELDDAARRFVEEAGDGELHIIANHPDDRDFAEYEEKEREIREDFVIPPDQPVLFLEVYVRDASDFSDVLRVEGVERGRPPGAPRARRRRSPTRSRRCCSTSATRRARGRTPTSTGRRATRCCT